MCNDDDTSKNQLDLFTPPDDNPYPFDSYYVAEFDRERARKLRELSARIKFLPGSLFHKREDDLSNEQRRTSDGDAVL